jgi:hypothetical protein
LGDPLRIAQVLVIYVFAIQMSFTLPQSNPRRTRLLVLGYGIAVFFWLRLEDNTIVPAALAGLGLSLVGAFLWITNNLGGKTLRLRFVLPGAALLGTICGLGASAATAGLMLLKNGMHAHVFPDFPFGVIVEILQLAPLWALAGGLIGFGLALAWWAFS